MAAIKLATLHEGAQGCLNTGPLASTPLHYHDELEVNTIIRGSATYDLAEGTAFLATGSVFWIFPGQVHRVSDASGDLRLLVVKWHQKLVDRVTECSNMVTPQWHASHGERTLLAELPPSRMNPLLHLSHEVSRQSGDTFNYGLVYLLARMWDESTGQCTHGRLAHPVVRRALTVLNDTTRESDVQALASDIGVSYSHLARLFKQETGQTIGDFRNQVRLATFFRYFHSGGTLLEAALNAGFGSYVQFYRVFRKHHGQSPYDYLRRSHTEPPPPVSCIKPLRGLSASTGDK